MGRLKRDKHGIRIKYGICKGCLTPEQRLNHYGVCEDCRREVRQALQVAYKIAVHDLDTVTRMSEQIRTLHAQGFSYRFQAEQMGKHVTPADLSRLVAGVEPKSPLKRDALGLPIQKLVTACSSCGKIHVTKRCAAKESARPRPRLIAAVSPSLHARVHAAAEARGISVAELVRGAVERELQEKP